MPKTTASVLILTALLIGLVLGVSVDTASACSCTGELRTQYRYSPIEAAAPDPADPSESSDPSESPDPPERNWTMIALIGMAIGVTFGVTLGRRRNR